MTGRCDYRAQDAMRPPGEKSQGPRPTMLTHRPGERGGAAIRRELVDVHRKFPERRWKLECAGGMRGDRDRFT